MQYGLLCHLYPWKGNGKHPLGSYVLKDKGSRNNSRDLPRGNHASSAWLPPAMRGLCGDGKNSEGHIP